MVTLGLSTAPCQCSRMNPENRKNCGFPGITSDQCFAAGCCFDSNVPGVPWCFHPLPKEGNLQDSLVSLGALGRQPRVQLTVPGDSCPGRQREEKRPSPRAHIWPPAPALGPFWQTHVGAHAGTEPVFPYWKKRQLSGPSYL